MAEMGSHETELIERYPVPSATGV